MHWHTDPINSIMWNPRDATELAVASGDMLAVWDLSVEKEDLMEQSGENWPDQLLFTHMGNKQVKELCFYNCVTPIITLTASDGFAALRPDIYT